MNRRNIGIKGSREHDIVSRAFGVTPSDSPIEGAEKALKIAISVWGENSRAVKQARKMIADAKARGMK